MENFEETLKNEEYSSTWYCIGRRINSEEKKSSSFVKNPCTQIKTLKKKLAFNVLKVSLTFESPTEHSIHLKSALFVCAQFTWHGESYFWNFVCVLEAKSRIHHA